MGHEISYFFRAVFLSEFWKPSKNEVGLSVFVFLVSRTRNHVREGFRPLALVTGSRCYACLELFRRGD